MSSQWVRAWLDIFDSKIVPSRLQLMLHIGEMLKVIKSAFAAGGKKNKNENANTQRFMS